MDPPPRTSAVSCQGPGQDWGKGVLPMPCTLQRHLLTHGFGQTEIRPGQRHLLHGTRVTTQIPWWQVWRAWGSPEPRKPKW